MKSPLPRWAAAAFLAALALGPLPGTAQSFTFVDAYFDEIGPIDGLNFVFATAVSPDGKHVYACSGNGGLVESDNAIVVFSRAADGRLTFVERHFDDNDSNDPGSADGLYSCRDVVVSPDGKHVYTAGFSEGEIGIFGRNAVSGALTFDSVVKDGVGLDGLGGVEALAMTSDGSALFAAGSIDDAIVAFSRNATTGALTFEDSAVNGLGGVTGLDRPLAVAVSADGKHVYVAAGGSRNFTGSDALTLFSWDAGLGELTFVAAYFEGATQATGVIDGLDWVSSVTVSPDGKHVYAAGGLDIQSTGSDGDPQDLDWIAIFSRDAVSGELTWRGAIDDFNFCAFDVLFEFETWAVVHPDGNRVFVTSSRSAVVELARDTTTGLLSFVHAECYFDDLSLGINLPRKLSVDPSGSHFYVPGNASDAVAVFDTAGIFTDGFESGDLSAWSSSTPP